LKEVSWQRSTGAVEEVESVERADTRQPKGANNKGQQKANRLRNVQRETNRRYCIFSKCIASARSQVGSAAPPSSLAEGMSYGI
jgi:hypothetical protein